jgi:uncharacterized protein (DUF2236 family)
MRAPPVLGALDPEAPLPFGPRSIVRAMVAEPVTALLVQRALVMDVAHPKVAAAVVHHSHFQRRPLSRAWATADAALRLVFGDETVARGAVRQIYDVHDHINGTLDAAPTGGCAAADAFQGHGADAPRAEQEYTAHDASLLLWVWATLVDTTEAAFTRWVRPLEPVEADVFYTEMRAFGRFFGIPDELLPAGRGAFSRYVGAVLARDDLGTSEHSRSLARQVLWFEHRAVPAPLVRLERVLALATLDTDLLERLGLRPDPADVALGHRLDAWLRSYYRHVPRSPRVAPALYVLLRRPSIGLSRRLRSVLGTPAASSS